MKVRPHELGPVRRNYTRQRERLLSVLRATDRHPTVAWLHEALLPEFPRLSLGTVYRNLEVLVAEGAVQEVPVRGRAARYDGNVEVHHHLVCEHCGAIEDLELQVPRGLEARAARRHGVRVHGCRIDLYGLCAACTDREERAQETQERQRGDSNHG